ncbi:MAG: FkbM family methyltransferase [candidate division WOR-3 bacterium]
MLYALLKEVSTNPLLLKIIRFLKLNQIMKKIYFMLNTIPFREKKVNFMGISAILQISNYDELKTFEQFFRENYGAEFLMLKALLEFLNEGDVAYDVGANIGLYTILMAKEVGSIGKIIAFEPDSKNFEALRRNLEVNSLNNVKPIKVALGDKVSEGSLYIKKRVGIGAVSLLQNEESDFRNTTKIFPGDFIVERKKIPLPKAIKIDVEGYEYLVLKGLKKTLSNNSCKLVCCEIHSNLTPAGITKENILNLIKSYGFNKINTYKRGSEIHAICYK